MSRLAALAAGLVLAATPIVAEAQTRWDFASPYPGTVYHGRNSQAFIEEVKKGTEGSVEIAFHPNASLFRLPEIRRAVQSGQIAIGEVLMSTMENQDPLYGLDAIPFLASDIDSARRLWEASREEIVSRMEKDGLKLLWAVVWPGQGLYVKNEIESLDDLKGVRLRIQNPGTARMAELFGSVPVRVEAAEVAQAMATGIIDAYFTSLVTGVDTKAWDTTSHYYNTDAWMPKNAVFMNMRMFERLSESEQAVILEAAATAEQRGWDMMMKETEDRTPTLCGEMTCVFDLPPKLMEGFQAVGDQMTEEWLEKAGPDGAAIIEAYRSGS